MIGKTKSTGFSLVELVIVIVIIGIIAAIAVPRISRGAAGAGSSGVRADLYVLRNAIDLYAAEHNSSYPTVADFVNQMTIYSDEAGNTNTAKGDPFFYGPYLAKVPALKVGEGVNHGKGKSKVGAAVAADTGWVYDALIGKITPNSVDAKDQAGVLYTDY